MTFDMCSHAHWAPDHFDAAQTSPAVDAYIDSRTNLSFGGVPLGQSASVRAATLVVRSIIEEAAMIVARWSIDARFGHKQAVVSALTQWQKEIGTVIGWTDMRLLSGSIGARESTVQSEVCMQDLAELNAAWDKLATIDAHKQWSKDLEPYIVSGTPRWEIFRILADRE